MLGLWIILTARAVPSIVYVRARLRLERGARGPVAPSLLAHATGLAAVAIAAASGLAPWLAAADAGGLLARALPGLSRYRLGHRPAAIGAQEVAVGLAVVAAAAFGYAAM
jgi:hypothetical protein